MPKSSLRATRRKRVFVAFLEQSWWLNWVWINTYIIPFLGEWTSIYQLFWCSPGVQGFDTLPTSNKWDWPNRNSETVWNSSIFQERYRAYLRLYQPQINRVIFGQQMKRSVAPVPRCHVLRGFRGFPPWRRFEKTNGLMIWLMVWESVGETPDLVHTMVNVIMVWERHPNWWTPHH